MADEAVTKQEIRCMRCGKDSRGRRRPSDPPKRHRRFYVLPDGNACGPCLKHFSKRAGK